MTQRLIAQHYDAAPVPLEIKVVEMDNFTVMLTVRERKTATIRISQDAWDELRQQIIANG